MNTKIQTYPAKPEDRLEWPFMVNGSNYIDAAADTLLEWVEGAHRPMFFAWNGTPFDAYPGDTAHQILNRWSDQRILWQKAIGAGWKPPRYA